MGFLLVIAYFRNGLPAGFSMKGLKVITCIIHFIDLITVLITVKEIKHKWLTAFSVTLFLFLLVNIFLFPLFNSGDDVFLMYTLAGGYGELPTNLLQYNYGWHPLLGWIVKSLFESCPGINCYTIFLLAIQILGYTIILYVLLKRYSVKIALFFYLILFLSIGVLGLLSLNYTLSSWLLAVAGMFLISNKLECGGSRTHIFIGLCCLFIAGLLRLHAMLAVVLMLGPYLFFFCRKLIKKLLPGFLILAFLLFMFNWQQQYFYKKNIPGWQLQENVRQSLIYTYNRPWDAEKPWEKVFKDSLEHSLYFNRFFYDTSIISLNRLQKISKALVRYRDFSRKNDFDVFYQLYIGLRLYVFLFLVIVCFLWVQGAAKGLLKKFLPLSFLIAIVYCYLIIFLKLTLAIHLGLLMIAWAFFMLSLSPATYFTLMNKKTYVVFALALLLPCIGIGKRIIESNVENKKNNQEFDCAIEELQRNRNKLFVATDDALPLGSFYIWKTPYTNKILNLVNKDRAITFTYKNTLARFNVTDLTTEMYQNKKVLLLGSGAHQLKEFYRLNFRVDVEVHALTDSFRCLEVNRMELAPVAAR